MHSTFQQARGLREGFFMVMTGELIGSIPEDELMLWVDWMFPAMNLPECPELLSAMGVGAPPEAFKAQAERVHMARGESVRQKLKTLLFSSTCILEQISVGYSLTCKLQFQNRKRGALYVYS
jgi:hypothetical protein